MREKTTNRINDLLNIWERFPDRENHEFTYQDLLEQIAREKSVSLRQASDYFPSLKLKLQSRKYHQTTLYKPLPEYWKRHLEFKQQAIQRDTFVRDTIDASLADAKLLTEKIRNQVFSEANFHEEEGCEESAFDLAINRILNERADEAARIKFYSLYRALIKSCLDPLSDPDIFARLALDEELPEIVEHQVAIILKRFMDLWAFSYKNEGIASLVTDILAKSDGRKEQAKKLAHLGK